MYEILKQIFSFELKKNEEIKLSYGQPLHRRTLREEMYCVSAKAEGGWLTLSPQPQRDLWSHRGCWEEGIQGCQRFLLRPLAVQRCITRCQCGLFLSLPLCVEDSSTQDLSSTQGWLQNHHFTKYFVYFNSFIFSASLKTQTL